MTIETMTITTYDVVDMTERERVFQVAHLENWANNYVTWFIDMVARHDFSGIPGTRYLYSKSVAQGRAGSTLCMAYSRVDCVEFSLGWMADLDMSYYWSLYSLLVDTFPDRWVSADVNNSCIWVK